MKVKVNFGEFPIYGDITKKTLVACDIRQGLANNLYMLVPGIEAHVLAEKIYKSNGEIELNETECSVIDGSLNLFNGSFADSWSDYVLKNKEC